MPVTPCAPAPSVEFMKRYDEALPVKLRNQLADRFPTATTPLSADTPSFPAGENVNSLGEQVGVLIDTFS